MADTPEDFERKKLEYEYPCCPHNVGGKPYYRQNYHIAQGGKSVIRNMLIPHHGAPFSCIRWTNLFFPYRCLILGDLIGGRLNGVFGKGIRDIAVGPSTDKYRDRTLFSHTRYWASSGKDGVKSIMKDVKPSLETLRNVMRLDFLRGKSAKAKPGGAP